MFEQNTQTSDVTRRDPVKVGKIKRDSFFEVVRSNSGSDGDIFKDQIKAGKLNITNLYPNSQQDSEENIRQDIKIGKINTKVS